MSPAALHVLRLLGQDHRLVRTATGWRVSTPGFAGYERVATETVEYLIAERYVARVTSPMGGGYHEITEAGHSVLRERD